MSRNNLLLFKLILKNDYIKILTWLASIIGITLATAYLYPSLYETAEAVANYGLIMKNPAMQGLVGGIYPPESYTHAIIFSAELLMFTAIAIAIMNIYFSIKFLKVAEEDGIIEIVNSKPYTRYSYLKSSVIILLLINFIIFITISIGLIIIDIPGSNLIGNIYYGLILFLIGIFFSGIGLVSSKLFNNSASSNTFSYLILIAFYVIRAIGDVLNEKISFLSPLGWMSKIQVYYENNFIYIFLLILFSIALYLFSFYLYKKIDYKSGLYNINKGKLTASKFLKTDFGLIFRLEKTQIFVWIFSLFILTAAFGSIFKEFEVFLEMDIIKQFFGESTENFSETIINYIIKIITLFGMIPALMIILKLSKEESKKYTDNIYTRKYPKILYFITHIVFALIISVLFQSVILIGLLSTGSEFILDVMSFPKLLIITLQYLPAIWIVISISALLISLGHKYAKYIWIYFSFIFITLYLEEILKIPNYIMNLSSFYHVSNDEVNILASILMTLLSLLVFGISTFLYKKREIN